MSYVLQIWAFPVPPSLAEVDGILAELNRRPRKPSTLFVPLAQRLTARHPCITTLDEDDENAVWTDGPMDGRSDQPVWGVGVLSQHIDTVVPFVVETATSMGFVVYDDQAGECHLPGGWSLLGDGRRVVGHHLGMPVPDRLDAASITRTLQQAIEPVLAINRFEFEPLTGEARRVKDEWSHVISLRVVPPEPGASGPAAGEWRCDADAAWGHTTLGRLWAELDRAAVLSGAGPAQRYRASARTTFSRLAWWAKYQAPAVLGVRRADTTWLLRNPDELRQVAIAWREVAGTPLPGMMDVQRDLEQLSIWCLGEDRHVWRPFPLLQRTPTGLEKLTVQRWLFDTEGCGGPAALLVLAGAGGYPNLARLLQRLTPVAAADAGAAMRLELAARALREAGQLPAG